MKLKNGEVVRNAFLYSMNTNHFRLSRATGKGTEKGKAIFTKFKNGSSVKVLLPGESGVVGNGLVWLEERDDELARELLINFYESKREYFVNLTKLHEEKLKILRTEMLEVQTDGPTV